VATEKALRLTVPEKPEAVVLGWVLAVKPAENGVPGDTVEGRASHAK